MMQTWKRKNNDKNLSRTFISVFYKAFTGTAVKYVMDIVTCNVNQCLYETAKPDE